jgi:hypothetical protein
MLIGRAAPDCCATCGGKLADTEALGVGQATSIPAGAVVFLTTPGPPSPAA